MKQIIILLAVFFYATIALCGETNSVMKSGGMIGHHLQVLNAYPKVEPIGKKTSSNPLSVEIAMWRVGDGILQVTHANGTLFKNSI